MPNDVIVPSLDDLAGLDFSRILRDDEDSHFLKATIERAEARLVPYIPITPEERLASFRKIGFHPHGIYLPDDDALREKLRAAVRHIGDIADVDQRLTAYYTLQDKTEALQKRGVVGHWTGQQAIARSKAQFRLVAFGRRGGKTTLAAAEAVGVAIARPRSWCWCAAPTMKLASRAFDYVRKMIEDLGVSIQTLRDTTQEKLIVLENGSRIEGVSLENVMSAAGAAIDFAVIDEAAQIVPEAWHRAILPPLTDRNGQALLISSWEGEGDFFHTKALEAQAEMIKSGDASDWEMFQDASYEVNFFAFPQGRHTPALQRAERETPALDFLEQYGAIPAGAKERVYGEFRERVHTGDYRFDPRHPVILAVDPAGGSNPYAVVVLQDYGDHVIQIDEFYEAHVSVEAITPILDRRIWRENVTDVVVDSALPVEVERWQKAGYPAYAVVSKPEIEARLPLQRNWLRDPKRYHTLHRQLVNDTLVDMGYPPDADYTMNAEQQKSVILVVEESMSDINMTPERLAYLKRCARYFVSSACTYTIAEYKAYSYAKKRQLNLNYKERPRDYMNHVMDALGYYFWQFKRFWGELPGEDRDILGLAPVPVGLLARIEPPPEYQEDATPVDTTPQWRGRMFLSNLRDSYGTLAEPKGRSLLKVCR